MRCSNFAASRLSCMWHWHCGVESILGVRGGYASVDKLLGGTGPTGVIGCSCTANFFALYVGQIRIWRIFSRNATIAQYTPWSIKSVPLLFF